MKKQCKVRDCTKIAIARGFCPTHYRRWRAYGDANMVLLEKHGMSNSHEYQIWADMKRRCYHPWHKSFSRYGGRGICVCDRWENSFKNFFSDMGSRPSKNYQLHRLDNDGNYEPQNCSWVTIKENLRHTSRSKYNIEDIKQIRTLYKTGKYTQKKIAETFGTTQQYVSEIVMRKKWA